VKIQERSAAAGTRRVPQNSGGGGRIPAAPSRLNISAGRAARTMAEDRDGPAVIIVSSKKPVMNYVTACVTAFNMGHSRLLIRARGRSISSAVDVVNLLRSGFLSGLRVERVSVGTEAAPPVSFIEIEVSKPQPR